MTVDPNCRIAMATVNWDEIRVSETSDGWDNYCLVNRTIYSRPDSPNAPRRMSMNQGQVDDLRSFRHFTVELCRVVIWI